MIHSRMDHKLGSDRSEKDSICTKVTGCTRNTRHKVALPQVMKMCSNAYFNCVHSKEAFGPAVENMEMAPGLHVTTARD